MAEFAARRAAFTEQPIFAEGRYRVSQMKYIIEWAPRYAEPAEHRCYDTPAISQDAGRRYQ